MFYSKRKYFYERGHLNESGRIINKKSIISIDQNLKKLIKMAVCHSGATVVLGYFPKLKKFCKIFRSVHQSMESIRIGD